MTRGRLLPLAIAALAMASLAASGCAESEKDRYIDDYEPLNERLLKIGEQVGRAPLQAGDATNADLADRFGRYASDLDRVRENIAALDTPADLADESRALTKSIGVVVRDLESISAAASGGDQQAAAAATLSLTDDSNAVNRAQNRLARATGADVGGTR